MISVSDILSAIECTEFIGNQSEQISEIISFDEHNADQRKLMWTNVKHSTKILPETKGTIIIPEGIKVPEHSTANFILVKNPRETFRQLMDVFFHEPEPVGISCTAQIDASCILGEHVFIGHHVIIEKGCSIGKYTQISHNTVIYKGTQIGEHVKIGANTTIGGAGFGYEKDKDGNYQKIYHIGNVVIDDCAEIGSNTTIDRAPLGSTFIHKNVKIDNQVHIAHGVEIGENTLVIANSMIAGSTRIGSNVWISPSVSVLNKMKIKDHSFIGIGSVVVSNIKEKVRVFGNPARLFES